MATERLDSLTTGMIAVQRPRCNVQFLAIPDSLQTSFIPVVGFLRTAKSGALRTRS